MGVARRLFLGLKHQSLCSKPQQCLQPASQDLGIAESEQKQEYGSPRSVLAKSASPPVLHEAASPVTPSASQNAYLESPPICLNGDHDASSPSPPSPSSPPPSSGVTGMLSASEASPHGSGILNPSCVDTYDERALLHIELDQLLTALSSGPLDQQQHAVTSIRKLAKDSPQVRDYLGDHGAVPLLVRVMESACDHQVLVSTSLATCNIAIGNSRNKNELVSCGILQALSSLMHVPGGGTLPSASRRSHESASGSGRPGLSRLALSDPDAVSLSEACAAILLTLSAEDKHRALIRGSPLLSPLCSLLYSPYASAQGKSDVVATLCNLLECPKSLQAILRFHPVPGLLTVLGELPGSRAAEKACTFLYRTSYVEAYLPCLVEGPVVEALVGVIRKGHLRHARAGWQGTAIRIKSDPCLPQISSRTKGTMYGHGFGASTRMACTLPWMSAPALPNPTPTAAAPAPGVTPAESAARIIELATSTLVNICERFKHIRRTAVDAGAIPLLTSICSPPAFTPSSAPSCSPLADAISPSPSPLPLSNKCLEKAHHLLSLLDKPASAPLVCLSTTPMLASGAPMSRAGPEQAHQEGQQEEDMRTRDPAVAQLMLECSRGAMRQMRRRAHLPSSSC